MPLLKSPLPLAVVRRPLTTTLPLALSTRWHGRRPRDQVLAHAAQETAGSVEDGAVVTEVEEVVRAGEHRQAGLVAWLDRGLRPARLPMARRIEKRTLRMVGTPNQRESKRLCEAGKDTLTV